MTERAYTVSELDALRRACETRWLFGTTYLSSNPTSSRSYVEHEKVTGVESLVRMHMAAGHTAQDIYDADRELLPQGEPK